MSTATYRVKGMTCQHCVHAVSDELRRLDGVAEVRVDLGSGTVTVVSTQPLDDGAVRASIDEAGYEMEQ